MKRQHRFQTEVIPCMEEYADENRDQWSKEPGDEADDYRKFKRAVVNLVPCFEWAQLDDQDEEVIPVIKLLGGMVMASALELRRMLEDDGDTSRITLWERQISR